MYSSTLPSTSALDRGGIQRHVPITLPPGKTRYPLNKRLGEPQGLSGRVRKLSPTPGFDLRTVESLYRLSYPGPPVCNNSTTNTVLICKSILREFWIWFITLGMNRIKNIVHRRIFKKQHKFSATGTFSVPRYNSWKARVQVGHAILSRYEQAQLLMRVTNYSVPHQFDVLSVLTTTHASTLRTELSSSRYHAEGEFYILRTKVNGVRIQMFNFVCVTGFRSLVPENSTLNSDNSEGGHRVTFVRVCVVYIYIYIYIWCANHFGNSEKKGVLAIRLLSILILVSSLTGHDRILVTYYSLPFQHYSFYFFFEGWGAYWRLSRIEWVVLFSSPIAINFNRFVSSGVSLVQSSTWITKCSVFEIHGT